ncbi:alpha/beta hydrolase [soil metagenome]
MTLHFNNTDIYFFAKGTSNPLVLLHGFLESSEIWEPFIESLAAKRQVVCIDLPGHGQSGNIGETHTMELMADVVVAVLGQLNITTAVFVGHSMGGYVSLAMAEKFPGMIKGLVLMNSSPIEDSKEKRINREKSIALVRKNKEAYVKMAITGLVAPKNKTRFKDEIDELTTRALQMEELGIIAALKGMKIRTNKELVLKRLTIMKIYVFGNQDPIISPYIAESVGKSGHCLIKNISGGHLSYLENKDEIEKMMYFID